MLFQLEHLYISETNKTRVLDVVLWCPPYMPCVLGLQGLFLDIYRLISLVDSLFIVISLSK